MQRFRRSWAFLRKSWELIREDRKLLVFPALSAVGFLLAMTGIFVLTGYFGWSSNSWRYAAVVVLFSYPMTFIATFFGVAFISMARRSLDGESVTVRGGLRCAVERIGVIAAWAALATGVGVILQALQQLSQGHGWLAERVGTWLLGLAWTAVAFFALPIIALEGVGPLQAVRRSARLFKERWGEGFTGIASIGAGMIVLMITIMVVWFAGLVLLFVFPPVGVVLLLVALAAFLASLALSFALGQLFSLLVYRYATTGQTYGSFTESDLQHAFKPRKKRRGLFGRLRGR
jgi:hypothetical protein